MAVEDMRDELLEGVDDLRQGVGYDRGKLGFVLSLSLGALWTNGPATEKIRLESYEYEGVYISRCATLYDNDGMAHTVHASRVYQKGGAFPRLLWQYGN